MTRITFGIIFLLIGVVILLDNILVIDIPSLWNFWPSLVILLGLKSLLERLDKPVWPLFIVMIGVFLQLITLEIVDGSIIGTLFWPIIFIGLGTYILSSKPARRTTSSASRSVSQDTSSKEDVTLKETSASTFEITRIFSSEKKMISSQQFSKGDLTIFAGEVTLDFSQAKLADKVVYVDQTVIFGTLTLRVPEHIAVTTSVTGLFGDIDDHRDKSLISTDSPTLSLRGAVIFGSIDIYSK